MKIYIQADVENKGYNLTTAGVRNRIISYWRAIGEGRLKGKVFADYVTHGTFGIPLSGFTDKHKEQKDAD